MGGVNSAREQDSSIGGGAGNVCLGVVHMEEEVQDRAQVEGEEKSKVKERHTERNKARNREGTRKQPAAHHGWYEDGVTRACRNLSQCGVIHIIKHAHCAGEK